MKKTLVFIIAIAVVGLASCGNNDCPSGVNTTNPQCPNYNPYAYQQPNTQYPQQNPYQSYPCQVGTPNCVNGYYTPQTQGGYPCQVGTPNCVNGYYTPQTQGGYPCQVGTPNCVNGYYSPQVPPR